MKIFKYLILGAITFCMFGVINVKASDIVIKGNSVFRKSATEASINFISNTNGTIYYTIDENASENIENIILGVNAGSITSNVTKNINISLSSGAKYVHIVVKDNLNNYSNILTISMPKNLYYFDNFEAYNVDSYPNYFVIKHNGSNEALQKISNINDNNVFNGYGTYGKGLDERIQFNSLTTGYAVLEADISASNITGNYYFGGIVIGENYNTDDRKIIVQVNNSNNKFFYSNTPANHTSNIVFEANTNYHVKIIVDIENNKYDYYINGIKANSESINVTPFTELTWFGIYNGSGTVHYDNIKFYSQNTNPEIHSIAKGLETNGTFEIDKTSLKKDEIVTIIPTPENGYRVKSVKINNNESGITNNITNYTFTMPDEDVIVNVEFEKIPFVVTINSVPGAIISPNGTINVKYGDNQNIVITAATGYKLTSVKVNNEEQLPLTDNKIIIANIIENKNVEVLVEKIEYEVIDGHGKKYTIGKDENVIFKIDADKSLFSDIYLNDEKLDSKNYTITEGSTIITINKDYLNTLSSGTYNLKATFTDGGEANTTFVIVESIIDNPNTSDLIIFSIILGIISLFGLLGVNIYIKKSS